MPPAATVTQPPQTTGPAANQTATAPQVLVPFTRASMHRTEWANLDTNLGVLSAVAPAVTTIDVPASGFLRSIWIEVVATGGTGTGAVFQADAPYSLVDTIVLRDTNGAPIFGPISGYEWYLTNLLGGYTWLQNPELWETFSTTTAAGNWKFALRVPVEIRQRDAVGSLPNMNAAQNYQLEITWRNSTSVFSTPPNGVLPSVRVRGILETWANPETHDPLGAPQATNPPHEGTTQFWSKRTTQVGVGQQMVPHTRVGNLIRNLVYIGRTAAGVRDNGVLPDVPELRWDTRSIRLETAAYHRANYQVKSGITLPTGVMCFPFHTDFSTHPGEELGDQYLQTVGSSRLEFGGTFATAGSVTVLTNDIVPNGSIFV